MANRERGEARLVAPSGAVYTLRLTVGACCELEDRTGQDFDALTVAVNRGRVTELCGLLWAALQPYHAAMFPTVDSVSPLVDAIGRMALRSELRAFLVLNGDDEPKIDGDHADDEEDEPEAGSLWRRLYIEARRHGIPAEMFWSFSMRELWREMAASRKRAREAREHRIEQAWWIAMLVWSGTKKLPDLDTLLKKTKSKKGRTQTWQEMKAALKALAAESSGPILRKES